MINAEKRGLLHLKRRDLALKLAREVEEDIQEGERFSRKPDFTHMNDLIIFDLRINTYDEFNAEKALRALNLAKLSA